MTALELEQRKEQTTCIHFNGFENQQCNAGFLYHKVRRYTLSWSPRAKYPCIACLNRSPMHCPKYQAPTPEMLAEKYRQAELVSATKDVIAHEAGTLKGIRGTIDCPVCGSVFWYMVGLTGKTNGYCTKAGCLRF